MISLCPSYADEMVIPYIGQILIKQKFNFCNRCQRPVLASIRSWTSAESAGRSYPARHIHFHRKEALLIPKPNSIHVIVHHPQTDEGKRTLAQRMAGVHADWVCDQMKKLNCPAEQKAQ